MAQELPVVRCNACGRELKEASSTPPTARKPCSSCGSTARIVALEVRCTSKVRSKLGLKARTASSRRPFLESISGDDLFRLTGQWHKLKRVIDRARDYYLEVITDPTTGKIIRYCEEPLSKHQGRGSAKRSKGTQPTRKRSTMLLVLAILTSSCSSVIYWDGTGVRFFMWRDQPLVAVTLLVVSAVFWWFWWRGAGSKSA